MVKSPHRKSATLARQAATRVQFAPDLRERLAAYPGTGKRRCLWCEIRESGFVGGYSTARDHARDLRPPRRSGFEVRFETSPSEQAQVDFARFEAGFADELGSKGVVWLFLMVLVYTRPIPYRSRAIFAISTAISSGDKTKST